MGLFSKLAFWKHEEPALPKDDLGLPSDKELGLGPGKEFEDTTAGLGGTENLGPPQFQQQPQQPTQQPVNLPPNAQPRIVEQQNYSQGTISRDQLDVISSKLDALRATMESINQRLINLEKIAEGEQDHRRRINW